MFQGLLFTRESYTATQAVIGRGSSSTLTVSFTASAPATQHGSSEFSFDIEFSEEVRLSYMTSKSHAFTVMGAAMEKAQGKNRPSNISWRVMIKPLAVSHVRNRRCSWEVTDPRQFLTYPNANRRNCYFSFD